MDKNIEKKLAHLKRKKRVRKKLEGTAERPRMSVHRSLNHIYAQIINDVEGRTLVSCSSMSPELRGSKVEGGNNFGLSLRPRLPGMSTMTSGWP